VLAVITRPTLAGEFDPIDAFVRQQMKAVGIPGMAVAIVKDGKIVYMTGYGESSPGVPITPQTPFMLASISKSFTAMAVMQLVEVGKINLDNPVKQYLTRLHFADEEAAGRITVWQLLHQISGFSTLSGRKHFFSRDVGQEALERGVRDNADEWLTASPGEKFQYSNVNYNMAALIVSEVSGMPFEQYVREKIYAPLKMTNSFTNEADAKMHGLTVGHRFWFGYPVAANDIPYSHTDLGAGGLFSSAEDLALYTLSNLGDESGKAVLSPAGFAELHKPGFHILRDIHYGLGWFVIRKPGEHLVWHRGDMVCFHTDIMLAPDERIGVVVLINANSPSKGVQLINVAEGVFGLARGKEPHVFKNDPVPNIVMYAILALIFLQLFWMVRTVRKVRCWKRYPELRPKRWKMWMGVIVSIILNLAIASAIFVVLPAVFEIPYSAIYLFMPDAFWVATICGGIALFWVVVRNVLVVLGFSIAVQNAAASKTS